MPNILRSPILYLATLGPAIRRRAAGVRRPAPIVALALLAGLAALLLPGHAHAWGYYGPYWHHWHPYYHHYGYWRPYGYWHHSFWIPGHWRGPYWIPGHWA